MNNRYIEIPESIRFTDPRTGETVEGDEGFFDFGIFLGKISDNPKWNSSFTLGCVLEDIWGSWYRREDDVLVLHELVWEALKEAVQNPKQLLITQMGPQIIAGFGLQPRLMPQILPFCRAVVSATTTDPRVKAA